MNQGGYGLQAILVASQPALPSLVRAPASATMFQLGRSDGADAVIRRTSVTLVQRFFEAGIGTHEPRCIAHTSSRDIKVSMPVSDASKLA